jgi:NADH:quinone reductase (non-electrogenic)
MKTRVTECYGIQYPIICGGMLWIGNPKLCAAISEAGGLGSITAANYNGGEELRAAIREVKALTDKPFNVNITLLPSFRITEQMYDDYFTVCCEEKVAGIEIAGRFADKYMDQVKAANVKIAHKVGSVRHAVKCEKLGYDAIIAAGWEEGGHPLDDDVTTMVLTPRIAESVSIPVITAGGIADGRGMAAAFNLGAEGVLMATRFLISTESILHDKIKEYMLTKQEMETTMICRSVGLQARAMKNTVASTVLSMEAERKGIQDIGQVVSGEKLREAIEVGDHDSAAFLIGQSVGFIREIKSCQEIIHDMVQEASKVLHGTIKRIYG